MDDIREQQETEPTTEPTFAECAARKGMGGRMLYRVREVSDILGVPESTLRDEMRAGRLRYHLPAGRRSGRLIRPQWVDEWIRDGIRGA